MSDNDDVDAFKGYQWSYFSSITDETLRLRVEKHLSSINWTALVEYASALRSEKECKILPDIGLGLNHIVRIIEFDDGARWIARLRMEPLSQDKDATLSARSIMRCEHNMIQFVQTRSNIPVPRVHAAELDPSGGVMAQFMLMDCLRGNVGMDLGLKVPPKHKKHVFSSIAQVQVELSRIQLPKIGTILHKNYDGSYEQGPIPGLGGPFETATEFYKAWAAKSEFGLPEERIKGATGSLFEEISAFTSSFKSLVGSSAERISVRNNGPFPLCHGDFGHNNMIFDDNYNLLGVIDWETAFAGPWELAGEFPLTLSVVPPDMDAPWNYDENGLPKDEETQQKFADREDYIDMVIEKEREMGITEEYRLSTALQDTNRQYLATAMTLYVRGKPGWYSKVVERLLEAVSC